MFLNISYLEIIDEQVYIRKEIQLILEFDIFQELFILRKLQPRWVVYKFRNELYVFATFVMYSNYFIVHNLFSP